MYGDAASTTSRNPERGGASARAGKGQRIKRPRMRLTAGSRGGRVAIRPAWSTVLDRGSRRNWFICPRRLFVGQAFSPRHHCGRAWRVIAWCDLSRGISAQIQDASARLFVRECGEKAWHVGLLARGQLERTSKYKIACLRSEQEGHVDVSGECKTTMTQRHVCYSSVIAIL